MPAEFAVGVGIFPGQRMRQLDFAEPVVKIVLVQSPYGFDLPLQVNDAAVGEHGNPVLVPLAVANHDVPFSKAHVFHSRSPAFSMA